jgi:hypothetical protein
MEHYFCFRQGVVVNNNVPTKLNCKYDYDIICYIWKKGGIKMLDNTITVKSICDYLRCRVEDMNDLLSRLQISQALFSCWIDTFGDGYEYGAKYYIEKGIESYDDFISELTIVLHKSLILYCK